MYRTKRVANLVLGAPHELQRALGQSYACKWYVFELHDGTVVHSQAFFYLAVFLTKTMQPPPLFTTSKTSGSSLKDSESLAFL